MPALSALLPQSAFQVLGYQCPLFVAIKIDKLYNLEDKKEKLKKKEDDQHAFIHNIFTPLTPLNYLPSHLPL